MNPLLTCFICGSMDIVVLEPVPLCSYHDVPPEIPIGVQDSDEEIVFEDLDDEEYNPNPYINPYDGYPIPVYPI